MKHDRKYNGILWVLSLIALVAVAFFAFGNEPSAFGGGVALATLPFFPIRILMDKEPGSGGGGAPLTQEQFQQRTLEAIGKVRENQDTIATNLATLDKEGKKLSEDFSKHCKEFEGLPSQVADVTRQLAKMELKIAMEARASFGSAIDMIRMNEELNALVNGIVRGVAIAKGKTIGIRDDQKKAWDEYQRAMSGGATPGSTYIATDELYTQIYSLIAEHGIWRMFDVIPASARTTRLLVDSTDPVMGAVAENTEPTEASYTGTSVSAAIKKLLGWIGISNELLEDSEVDVTSHILMKFARATAYRMDFFALAADGTDDTTNGAMTGIFQGGTLTTAATGNTSTATLDFEDFLLPMLAVDAAVLSRPGTRWWMHPQNVVRILRVKDLNGRPIFLPSIDAPAPGALGSILGYPVTLAHAAPSADTTSSRIAAFGDPMGNAVLLRKDLQFAASDQVKFTEDKTVFRARARAATKVKAATAFGVLRNAAS